MKRILLIVLLPAVAMSITGCSLVGCDRVFPHLTWYWSAEAKRCRESHRNDKQLDQQSKTNEPAR